MGEMAAPPGRSLRSPSQDVPARVVQTLLGSQYGILLLDEAMDVRWISEAGATLLHRTVEEIVGRSAMEFLDLGQGPGALAAVAALLQSPEERYGNRGWVLPQRVRLRCGDGISREFEFGARAVDGEPPEMVLVFQDMSERARLEDVLMSVTEHDLEGALEQFLRLAAEQQQTGVGIMLHPSLGGSTYASAGARPSLFDKLDGDSKTQVRTITAAGGAVVGWLVVDREEVSPWDDETIGRLSALLGIVLSHQATFTHLVDAAATDSLTGLSNRRVLDMALAAASLNPSGGWAMLYCDLDRFKAVNDAHGHDAGDAVLRAVGERLRQVVRSGDLIARMGGDEFVVLAQTDRRHAEDLAERVRVSLSQPIQDRLGTFEVGVSVGVATAKTTEGIRRLLTASDDAMRIDKAIRRLTAPER